MEPGSLISIFCTHGKFRHFKGGIYEVLFEAENAETQETMVVYRRVDTGKMYVRSKVEFLGVVRIPTEKTIPRFERIEE